MPLIPAWLAASGHSAELRTAKNGRDKTSDLADAERVICHQLGYKEVEQLAAQDAASLAAVLEAAGMPLLARQKVVRDVDRFRRGPVPGSATTTNGDYAAVNVASDDESDAGRATIGGYVLRDERSARKQLWLSKYKLKSQLLPRRQFDGRDSWRPVVSGYNGGEPYSLWSTTVAQAADINLTSALYLSGLRFFGLMFTIGGGITALMDLGDPSPSQELVCLDVKCENRALHNTAQLTVTHGAIDLASSMVICTAIILFGEAAVQLAERLASRERRTRHYAVMVTNPPPSATLSDDWVDYFKRHFGDDQVAWVTVSLQNTHLLRTVQEYRGCIRNMQLDGGLLSDDSTRMPPALWWVQHLGLWRSTPEYWLERAWRAEEKVVAMYKDGIQTEALKRAAKVLVVFRTTDARRRCLESFAQPCGGACSRPSPHLQFEECDLDVVPAPDSGEIIWENFGDTADAKLRLVLTVLWGLFVAVALAGAAVAGAGAVMRAEFPDNSTGGLPLRAMVVAVYVVVANTCIGYVLTALSSLEAHWLRADREISLFWKLATARSVVITLAVWANTPFEDMLSADTLDAIRCTLIAEAVVPPLLTFINAAYWYRMAVAVTGQTQEKMDVAWAACTWSPAEKYAGIVKMLAGVLFYSAVVPTALVIGGLHFALTYAVDRYCILRRWKPLPPRTRDERALLVQVSALLPILVCVHVFSTLYFFTGWPMDNLCRSAQVPDLMVLGMDRTNMTLSDVEVFGVCDQRPGRVARDILLANSDPVAIGEATAHLAPAQKELCLVYAVAGFGLVFAIVVITSVVSGLASCKPVSMLAGAQHAADFDDAATPGDKLSDATDEQKRQTGVLEPYLPQVRVSGYDTPLFVFDIQRFRDHESTAIPPVYPTVQSHVAFDTHGCDLANFCLASKFDAGRLFTTTVTTPQRLHSNAFKTSNLGRYSVVFAAVRHDVPPSKAKFKKRVFVFPAKPSGRSLKSAAIGLTLQSVDKRIVVAAAPKHAALDATEKDDPSLVGLRKDDVLIQAGLVPLKEMTAGEATALINSLGRPFELHIKRPIPPPQPSAAAALTLGAPCSVIVGNSYQMGRVFYINPNMTYQVRYDDGSTDVEVTIDNMVVGRQGTRVGEELSDAKHYYDRLEAQAKNARAKEAVALKPKLSADEPDSGGSINGAVLEALTGVRLQSKWPLGKPIQRDHLAGGNNDPSSERGNASLSTMDRFLLMKKFMNKRKKSQAAAGARHSNTGDPLDGAYKDYHEDMQRQLDRSKVKKKTRGDAKAKAKAAAETITR